MAPTQLMSQPLHIDPLTGERAPICVDCGHVFLREAGEEAARRGTGMPASPRCAECRAQRRAEHNFDVLDSLRRGPIREAHPTVVGPEGGGDRVYAADCTACRRPIRLPFKPRLDRPVYCRYCHDQRLGR
ncbi:MAG: hypothetical protein KC432_06450 [Thermomicrobiales bacterium]|nr:hypothetical protein [Thermomicrobiales bacterium]